nr:HlyD family efflux transporter periplasmic adaptor subunit [Luteibacter yeojuensis]
MLRQEAKISTLRLQAESQRSRVSLLRELDASKVSAKQDAVEQAEVLQAQARHNVDALAVRAAIAGPVQDVFVSLGQSVAQGEKLAQVADAGHLVASLKVPQTHASQLAVGSPASLSIMGRQVPGHIVRVDPKVKDGAVMVDVQPLRPLPSGVRVAQSVSGDIQTISDSDAVYLPRREGMIPYSNAILYVRAGQDLMPRTVRFGAASDAQIEVVSGLTGGEEIAANLPATADASRIRIER